MGRKQVIPDRGRRVPVVRRATWLVRRGADLATAEYHYNWLVTVFRKLFTGLEGNEFAAKVDRQALAQLEAVLEGEIRPQKRAVWEEFVGLFGFGWRDRVRVANRGRPTVEVEPTYLHFNPWQARPTAQLQGRALERDGRPGERIAHTPLILGVSKVTVLAAAADRG